MTSWLPQNLQKRLLLYTLKQVSLFSNVDVSNLDVSIGSQSHFGFTDIDLNVCEINLPNIEVLSGRISKLYLQLAVAGNVEISGEGMVFVLKPADGFFDDDSSEQWASSLTKSVMDMTKSILDTELSEYQSKIYNDTNEDIKPPTALDSMMDKVLRVALSKLTINLKNVELQLIISPELMLKISISEVKMISADEKRIADVSGVSAVFSKPEQSVPSYGSSSSDKEDDRNTSDSEDPLSTSITYSKLEATSIYLSAMESLVLDSLDGGTYQFLNIDKIEVQFQGITSINDMKVHDLKIKINAFDIHLENVSSILSHIMSLLNHVQLSNSEDKIRTQELKSYKRFQHEQNIEEDKTLTLVFLKSLKFHLRDNLFIMLTEISLNSSVSHYTSVSISDIQLVLDSKEYINRSDSSEPFLSLNKNSSTSEQKLHLNRDIKVEVDYSLMKQLILFANDYMCLYNQIIERPSTYADPSADPKFLLISQNVCFLLDLGDLIMEFHFSPFFSNVPHTTFKVPKLSIFSVQNNEKSRIGELTDFEFHTRKSGCFNISGANSKFCASNVNTKTKATLENLEVSILESDMNKIIQCLSGVLGSLPELLLSSGETTSSKNMEKRSVRMMQSSAFLHNRTALSMFCVQINCMKIKISNISGKAFGDLMITARKSLIYQDKYSDLSISFTEFTAQRQYLSEKTDIIFDIKHDSNIANFVINRTKVGKIKAYLTGVGIFIHTKWSELFSGQRTENSINEQNKNAKNLVSFPIDIKLYDCALSLKPCRLSTGLAINIPRAQININKNEITLSTKILDLLLIDDMNLIHKTDLSHTTSTSNWYEKQGYSSLVKIDTLSVRFCRGAVASTRVSVHKIDSSICSDSFNALIQTIIDLKPVVTYPENVKYQVEPELVSVFEDLTDQYFTTASISENDLELYPDTYSNSGESLVFEENYFSPKLESPSKNEVNMAVFEILSNVKISVDEIKLKLYDGYDWKHTRKEINSAVEQLEENFKDGLSCPDAKVFDSIYIPAPRDEDENIKSNINMKIHNEETKEGKMKLRPTKKYKILIHGNGIKVNIQSGNDELRTTSTLPLSDNTYDILNETSVQINNLEIVDNLPTSTWNKFLTRTKLKTTNTLQQSAMLSLRFAMIRPTPHLYATELICNVHVKPISLHVDQDALEFLTLFFQFKDPRFELIDDYPDIPYIQRFEINSVKILLDYKPKKVDYVGLRSGKTKEFMNFFILDQAKINLKHVILYGIDGFSRLETILTDIWTPDITKTQLPGILGALTPFKPFAGLSYGARALVSVPTEQYQQSGRLGTSLQKGGMVFLRTTGGEFVKLAVRLTSGTQTILESTEKLLGGQGSNGRNIKIKLVEGDDIVDAFIDESILRSTTLFDNTANNNNHLDVILPQGDTQKVISLYADQPKDFYSGLHDAYSSFGRNLNITFDSMKQAKNDIKTANGAQEAVSTVAKAAPLALIRPLIGVTEALSKTLQGLNNQYDQEEIAHIEEKYKSSN